MKCLVTIPDFEIGAVWRLCRRMEGVTPQGLVELLLTAVAEVEIRPTSRRAKEMARMLGIKKDRKKRLTGANHE